MKMSNKTYICLNCLATAHHKGKCDMCDAKLVILEDLSEEQLLEIIEKFRKKK